MVDVDASVSRSPSGIPRAVNKRSSHSFSLNTSPATSSVTPGGRAVSPVVLSAPPTGKNASSRHIHRRSLLYPSSPSEAWHPPYSPDTDDPDVLKAHIQQLNVMLHSSYQNSASYLADAGLSPSTPGSARPFTPGNGNFERPSYTLSTPHSEPARVLNPSHQQNIAEGSLPNGVEQSLTSKLPHSTSSYDLRSSAITPGKTPEVRKTSDGPLGISRIPLSAVTQGLALHATSHSTSPTAIKAIPGRSQATSPTPLNDTDHLRSPFLGAETSLFSRSSQEDRYSPAVRKVSGGSAASTRVIDGLQTDLLNARGHNEKLKQEVRSNQRLIGSLTRQNEDLKETRERMRVECEGLNNVIARKERLLQEVLERARAAESSLAQHLATKKALEQSTKKSLQEMTARMNDAQAAHAKADSESTSLRESVRSLKGVWAKELKAAREEIRKAEERGQQDLAAAKSSHSALIKLVESQAGVLADRATVQSLAEEAVNESTNLTALFEVETQELRAQAQKCAEETAAAQKMTAELAAELAHLRRLMREPRRPSLDEAAHAEAAHNESS